MYNKGTLFKIISNNEVCIYISRYNEKELIVFYDNKEWVFFENELEVIDVQSK